MTCGGTLVAGGRRRRARDGAGRHGGHHSALLHSADSQRMITFGYIAGARADPNNEVMSGPSRALPLVAAGVLALAGAAGLGGCAHTERAGSDALSQRRLLVLERDFAAFVARPLAGPEDIEDETASLEALRLDYLDVLSRAEHPRDRLLCLLRIAELHLDLGARIRRVPYPPGATEGEMRAFDEALSQDALPLEAVGRGVLAQAVDYAETHHLDGRFVRRARLYRSLHGGETLDADELAWLRRELVDRSFGAPRTLLEAGRIGQRAARR